MKKKGLFFYGLFCLFLLTGCGQTGSLYYPKPVKHPSKNSSTTKTLPVTSTSVKKSEAVI